MEPFLKVAVVAVEGPLCGQGVKGGTLPSPGLLGASRWTPVTLNTLRNSLFQVHCSPAEPGIARALSILEFASWARWKRVRNNGEKDKVILSQFVLAQQEYKELKIIF